MQEFLRLVARITRGHRRTFSLAVGGAATYAVCTVLSASAVRHVIDTAITPRFDEGSVATGSVVIAMLLLFVLGLVRALGVVVRRSFAGVTEWRAAGSFASSVVERISHQPVWWLRRHPTGEVVSRLTVDAEATVAMLAPLPFASSVVVLLLFAGTAMVVVDVVLGLIGLVVMPVLLLVNLRYQRRVDSFFAEAQGHLGDLSSAVHESFEGVTVVKAFGAEEREAHRLSAVAERLRDARLETVRLRSRFESLLDLIPSTGIVVILFVGAWRVGRGELTVGDVGGFVYLFSLLSFPLRIIGYALSELPHSRAGLSHIDGLLAEGIETRRAPMRTVGVGIEIRGMSVRFDGQSIDAVTVARLSVRAGGSLAVVGETGSGKSILVGALAGVIPYSGEIRVAQSGVAPVFQETFLFATSIRENLVFGAARTDDEIRAALSAAEALEFVEALPDGIETIVGERGVGLSGGQRQRLALARAILSNRDVLVLDDTTSALDPETEARVVHNLLGSSVDKTLLVVASRPSTVALIGRVAYLAEGRIVDEGTHDDLFLRCAGYRALMESYESDRRDE